MLSKACGLWAKAGATFSTTWYWFNGWYSVETKRWPKALFKVASIICAEMPSLEAVARSTTRRVCKPLSWKSALTSVSCGSFSIASRSFGVRLRNSAKSLASRLYWNCAAPARAPIWMSCCGFKNRFAPATFANWGLSLLTISCAEAWRAGLGFSSANIEPVLFCPPAKPPVYS